MAVEDDAANLEAVLDPQGEEEVPDEEVTEDAEGEEAPQEEAEPEAGDEGAYLSYHASEVGRRKIMKIFFSRC